MSHDLQVTQMFNQLGGGFKYFLCSPLFGEDFQFDEHIFQMGGSTTNQQMFNQIC